jgi:hypothetical protein
MFLNSGRVSKYTTFSPVLNSSLRPGEFYANDFGPANLELLADFFASYPGYADKVFLSVKVGWITMHRLTYICYQGGAQDHSLTPDSS